MPDIPESRLYEVFSAFLPGAGIFRAAQYFGGHINRTFFVEAAAPGARSSRFVLQSINKHVFPNYLGLMDNVFRISDHLARKSREAGNGPDARDHLHFIRTADGAPGLDGPEGYWRLYRCIDRAKGRPQAETPDEAREAARAFGRFQLLLSDLPGPRLVETIPRFHDTRNRFERLEAAFAADAEGRAAGCRAEYEGFLELRPAALRLQEAHEAGLVPERIAHNDAKFSNLLIDDATGRALCVIDLDTCMPGLSLHDFGDLMRSMCCDRPEDEEDLSLVVARREMYDALAEGFLGELGAVLTPEERRILPYGGLAMTLEVGVRFLTDHLDGDHYFRIARPGHNLVRARSQLALARSMLEHLPV